VYQNIEMISVKVLCKKEVIEVMEPVTRIVSVSIKLVRKT